MNFILTARFLCILILLGSSFTPVSANTKISIHPKIKAVTLYADRAIVIRKERITLKKGKYSLIFEEASPILDPRSLSAFTQSKNIVIRGVNTWTQKQARSLNPQIQRLETLIYRNQKNNDLILLSQKRLKADIKGVISYSNYLKKSINEGSKSGKKFQIKKWKEAQDFFIKRQTLSIAKDLELEKELQNNKKQRNFLSAKLRKIKIEKNKIKRIIEIQIHAKKNTNTIIALSYMMKNTAWFVSYGMHLKKGILHIDYYGNIIQQSGEDWEKVKLSLSTSNPARGIARSKISALSVFAKKVSTQTVYSQVREKAQEEVADNQLDDEKNLDRATSNKQKKHFHQVLFKVPGRNNIKSGKKSMRVKISSFQIKPKEFYYRIVPSISQAAHFSLKAINHLNYPLLAGSVDLFKKSGYVGSTLFKHTRRGGNFQLSFGADRRVSVKRRVIRKKAKEGIISSQKIFITNSQSWISNHTKKKVKIEYFEQVPVSETEDIKITVFADSSPSYTETRKGNGVYVWKRILNPSQKVNLKLHYKVVVPNKYRGTIYGR